MALNNAASDGQFSNGAGFLLQGRSGGQDCIYNITYILRGKFEDCAYFFEEKQ